MAVHGVLSVQGANKNLWNCMSQDPDWVREQHGENWFDASLEPLYWGKVFMSIWERAELAIDTFIFAETFDIPRLRQDSIDRLVWCHNLAHIGSVTESFVSTAATQKAYIHTKRGSGLRKVLADGWYEFENKERLGDRLVLQVLPHDFLIDIWMKVRSEGDGEID
jgi:hypothetical protein